MLTVPEVHLAPLLPVLIVLAGAVASTVLGFHLPRRALTFINLAMLVLSGISMGYLWNSGEAAFGGALQADNAAILLGLTILLGSAMTLLVSLDTAFRARVSFPEFDAMLMYAVTGTLLIAFSGDLITMLIGLEIMSLSGYVLATMQDSRQAEESGLKYFLLGAAGSAVLIYGIAFVYGATGSLNYAGIAAKTAGLTPGNLGVLVGGALLLLAGFAFKVALAPFHQWTPDVYSGAPTSVSLFLSTVVKVAAFAGMLRVFGGALQNAPGWAPVLQILIAVTLIVGNAASLFQTNFKRMLAYSAVAHTGFLAMTLLGTPGMGGAAMAYYLLVYTLMTAAAFAIVAALQRSEKGMEISDLRGLYYRHPAYAVALAACLASLAGLPPFAGFFGKYLAFQAALQGGYVWLAVLAALASVAALVYYLRPAMLMFMPDRTPAREYAHGERPATTFTVALGVIGVTVLGILPNLWYGWVANPGIWGALAGR
ncbi:NADH-quinone oxidoreductase subunit NuoN [Deinococcus metallilatus]|uniref:NADH-quinone oxidoreductase subunit N n=1 Tax=Deinococcus metallilatus TaxID=1211322 RepID=A0AAJ5JXG6_9DEIO|nr:NADH-quinone oxidoreductase subunit NuoN [Deinococcus metallilatus]MBB5294342.1 NADH-quinone oxidoreductase subunit N [Deinococcus metallilatus]QBY09112.1 NADH-quinone oxidoreductase subunit NuoN [Deinococcus metallilatus]RXJ10256.1 NADH-quinone oxidoreductase subunit NuoN [Deinococcus metallilatus]TLK22548.1 NADH-quinone oxidoreductase subunit NuoN [Deinococcus metallilatus]GMA16320.1 NADH-quinone oxidoreductase subunit N [Deinococcus metallilatus]